MLTFNSKTELFQYDLDEVIEWDQDEEKLDLREAIALIAAFSLGETV